MEESWSKRLSEALNLEEHPQDWGICNADKTRLLEFLSFYENHEPQHPWDTEALAELIIESFNLKLKSGEAMESQLKLFLGFVNTHSHEFPRQVQYWSGLNGPEFPVAAIIRDSMAT